MVPAGSRPKISPIFCAARSVTMTLVVILLSAVLGSAVKITALLKEIVPITTLSHDS
jgi:hypothetical protein